MKKAFIFLVTLALVLGFSLVTAAPVAAANTIGSSTIIFESQPSYTLTDNGDGTYSGVIPCKVDGSYDIYAKEGATAYFDDTPQVIAGHDAWPTWTPDTPDWYQYSLHFYEEGSVHKWALRNHAGATAETPWYEGGDIARGVPMSGIMDWDTMYAWETDVGAYLLGTGTAKYPGTAESHGGGVGYWDMDWSWGSEAVPLQFAGFAVEVTPSGSYTVTLTPADPPNTVTSSTMVFDGDLTDVGGGVYTGTIPMVNEETESLGDGIAGFDVYAKEGGCAYVEGYYGTGDWNCDGADTAVIDSTHDAYSSGGPWGTWYDPDCADWDQYSLELTADHWYLRYTATGESPMSGVMYWYGDGTGYAAETDPGTLKVDHGGTSTDPTEYTAGSAQEWGWHCGWGEERIPLELPGFAVDVTPSGSYTVTLTPAAGPVLNVNTGVTYGTIQLAVDDAGAGHTLQVAAGTYAGAIVNKDVTISGAPGGGSVITSGVPYKTGGAYDTAFRLDAGADGAEINNFTINNSQPDGFYFAVFARGVDDVTVDNLEINDTVQGISNWGGSGWVITGNTITDTVAAGGGGIAIFLGATPPSYRTCSDNLVQYNTIDASATAETYSCPGICLALDTRYGAYDELDGSEDISGNQILDNTITASGANNGVGIEVGAILGDSEEDPDRTDPVKIAAIMDAAAVHDNTVQENTTDGADMGIYFYNVTGLTITQNTIENSVGYGIYAEHGQSGTVITGNTFTDNEVQLKDETVDTGTLDPLDIVTILNSNTFDRAVTVDHPGASLLHTIWSSIQDAIDAAVAGDTIWVSAGTYHEGIIQIDKNLTITGATTPSKPVINPTQDTGTDNIIGQSGRGWFQIHGGATVNFENLVFDGAGKLVYTAVHYHGDSAGGTVENCDFMNIAHTPAGYQGRGINNYGQHVDVLDCTFSNIYRIGVFTYNSGATTYISGCIYTGKGDGDWLDYAFEAGAGGFIDVEDCTITDCRGVALVDNSTSASILVTTYYGAGTTATITGSTLTNNTEGIAVGYDEYDTSTVVAHYNNIYGNTDYGVATTASLVDATYNWWGSSSGPYHATLNPGGTGNAVSDNVLFEPWLVEVPAVTTQAATEVGFLKAKVNVNYTVGGYSPVQVRFAYKKSTDAEWSYTAWASKSEDGTCVRLLRPLRPNTIYDFKAQLRYDDIVNGEAVIEGDILQFTTRLVESCFIATAAYGTPNAEQIDVLREFRDRVLLESTLGSQFVALYYQLSPSVAEFIAGNELLRTMVRELLVAPIVWVVEATGNVWRD